jgi:hypothetical protein
MRERIQQLNAQVRRVDGPVDWDLIPVSPPLRDSRRVRIVYATSRWAKDDLASLFLEDMQRLLSTYQGRIEFFCWGYHPPELRGHPVVRFLDFVPDYDHFFRRFARSGFDIGLAPLRDEVFYRSKSNNKFREYAACRIAGVYSDLPVYSTCVTSRQTGLLVPNRPGAWFRALSQLVEDQALRHHIQEQAFAYARTHYSLEKAQALWLEQISWAIADTYRRSPVGNKQYGGQNKSPGFVSCSSAQRQSHSLTQLPLHFAVRGLRLISGMRARGIKATIRKVQWSLRDLHGLLRVKWNLSYLSRRSASAGEDASS